MCILDWSTASQAQRRQALARPAQAGAEDLHAQVREILAAVRERGDAAVRDFTRRFDGITLNDFEVGASEFAAASQRLSTAQHAAIDQAIANVHAFHQAQATPAVRVETAPGVLCERLVRPIRAVGLYVPAGRAPLPSTAIMLAVPAAIAGCAERVLCTPPDTQGRADPAVLVAAHRAGATRLFKIGGAQAVAALAFGTESVPRCDKIFGPGNAWVTAAKLLAAQAPDGAAFDLPAGPSEVLVVADAQANPEFVAADLLAQAEHSADAQALLVTDSAALAAAVAAELSVQAAGLSRRAILAESLQHLRLIVAPDLSTAFDIVNLHAPEHLIVQVRDARDWLPRIQHAGAVFLGPWSPESVGDYCSGPNHTLPTYGQARAYSGLGLEDFQKRITVQELTAAGLRALGETTTVLARLEGLEAHAQAVTRRLRVAS
ncbi:MAG: histidinol dehydrogenase [Proteobacteria bacterium]|nr:histidinol dehydrogenase [Pseudomonadota bacterium]